MFEIQKKGETVMSTWTKKALVIIITLVTILMITKTAG